MNNAAVRTGARLALLLVLLNGSVVAAQSGAPAATTATGAALVIKGSVKQEISLTLADLKALPRTKLSAKGHDGAMHDYEGVPLQALSPRPALPPPATFAARAWRCSQSPKPATATRLFFPLPSSTPTSPPNPYSSPTPPTARNWAPTKARCAWLSPATNVKAAGCAC
jgi:hypothetical protein